jgi:hypothetical protein
MTLCDSVRDSDSASSNFLDCHDVKTQQNSPSQRDQNFASTVSTSVDRMPRGCRIVWQVMTTQHDETCVCNDSTEVAPKAVTPVTPVTRARTLAHSLAGRCGALAADGVV